MQSRESVEKHIRVELRSKVFRLSPFKASQINSFAKAWFEYHRQVLGEHLVQKWPLENHDRECAVDP